MATGRQPYIEEKNNEKNETAENFIFRNKPAGTRTLKKIYALPSKLQA